MILTTAVCLCGSSKYKPLVHALSEDLRHAGFLVHTPPLHDMSFASELTAEQALIAWRGVSWAHFARITKSDVVLFVNPDGYSGVSSTLELGYAAALGKLIIALWPDAELARAGLFDRVLGTCERADVLNALVEILGSRPK